MSSSTKLPMTSIREMDTQHLEYLEKIYSNYEEISAQQEEIAARKDVLDVEFMRANTDGIAALIHSGDRDAARFGEWDTYDRVQYILKKFVYSRSQDMRQLADAELALKDRLTFYTETCTEQKKRIESLEAALSAVQEELADLMNIMQLRAKELNKSSEANAVNLLRIAQLQRECDSLRNLSDMDERAICKDFRFLVKANKKLEEENAHLRAVACINPSVDFTAVSSLLENVTSLVPGRRSDKKHKKLNAKETMSAETNASNELQTGIEDGDDASGKGSISGESAASSRRQALSETESVGASRKREQRKRDLSASLKRSKKKKKGAKPPKGTEKGNMEKSLSSSTSLGSTSNKSALAKALKNVRTETTSKRKEGKAKEESHPVMENSHGEVVALLCPDNHDKAGTKESMNDSSRNLLEMVANSNSHTAPPHADNRPSVSPGPVPSGASSQFHESVDNKSSWEGEDEEFGSSVGSRLMDDKERALYLLREVPLTAAMRRLHKERENWLRYSEFGESAAFASFDYDAHSVYQAQANRGTVDVATNTDQEEEWDKSKYMGSQEEEVNNSWKSDSVVFGSKKELLGTTTAYMSTIGSVVESEPKASKKVLVTFVDSVEDSQEPFSERDLSEPSTSFSTLIDGQQELPFSDAQKERDRLRAQKLHVAKGSGTVRGMVDETHELKEYFSLAPSEHQTRFAHYESNLANAFSSVKKSPLHAAVGSLAEKRESLKRKLSTQALPGEPLEKIQGSATNSSNLGEEALKIRHLLGSARDETAAVGQFQRRLQADMNELFSLIGNALHALSSGNAQEFMQEVESEQEVFEAQVTENVVADIVEQRVFDRLAEEGIAVQRHEGHPTKLTDEQWVENKLYDAITQYSRENIAGDIIKDIQHSEQKAVSKGGNKSLPGSAAMKGGCKSSSAARESKTRTSSRSSTARSHGAHLPIEDTSQEEMHHHVKSRSASTNGEDTWEPFDTEDVFDEHHGPYKRYDRDSDNDNNSDNSGKAPEALWVSEYTSWTSPGIGGSSSFRHAPVIPHQQAGPITREDLPQNVGAVVPISLRGRLMGVPKVKQSPRVQKPPYNQLPDIRNRAPSIDWSSSFPKNLDAEDRPLSTAGAAGGAWHNAHAMPGRPARPFAGGRGSWSRGVNLPQPVPIGTSPLNINACALNKPAIPLPSRFNHNILEYLRALRSRFHIPNLDMAPIVYRYDFRSALERIRERVQRSVSVAMKNLDGPEFENHLNENIMPYARAVKILRDTPRMMPWATRAIRHLRFEEKERQRIRARALFGRVVTNMRAKRLLKSHLCKGSALASFVVVLWNKWKQRSHDKEKSQRDEGVKVLGKIMDLLSAMPHGHHRTPQKQKAKEKPLPKRSFLADPSSKHFSEVQFPDK